VATPKNLAIGIPSGTDGRVRTTHRIYLSPGMFGFGRLASYDYFEHLEVGLIERFQEAGALAEVFVVDVPPTASIRRRAAKLADLITRTSRDGSGPIHLLGHSTGGLDCRLVASPGAHLGIDRDVLGWVDRLASVTLLSTPNHGTPLATFFATAKGARLLYALSAFTFVLLAIGTPPLTIASQLVVSIGRIDRQLGMQLDLLESVTDKLLALLDANRAREVRSYLDAIKRDQAAVIQLTPEAMDLFQAGMDDRPGVRYQSVLAMAPLPKAKNVAASVLSPWRIVSYAIFATLHTLTGRVDERYPCAPARIEPEVERLLIAAFGRMPDLDASDGVVPLRSQIHGRIVWAGLADHLDVLGHFRGKAGSLHRDWLSSGARYDDDRFARMLDAIAGGMIEASEPRKAMAG
jgi:triacylglycerol lipase